MSTSRMKWLLVGIFASTGVSFVHHYHLLHQEQSKMGTLFGANDEDSNFYRDLREAKRSNLGSDIPKEQLKESASSLESEFLEAMRQAKNEFREAKEKLGFDGAVDMILGRLREEDSDGDRALRIQDSETLDKGDDDSKG